MPRNFGLRQSLHRFWNEPANDNDRDSVWPFVAIGIPVVLIVLVAIFVV